MKCLNADATYGISSPPPRLRPLHPHHHSSPSCEAGKGRIQTKPTWVMGSNWRTEQGQLENAADVPDRQEEG